MREEIWLLNEKLKVINIIFLHYFFLLFFFFNAKVIPPTSYLTVSKIFENIY